MGSYWEFGFEFIELAVVPAFCTLRTDRLQTFVGSGDRNGLWNRNSAIVQKNKEETKCHT